MQSSDVYDGLRPEVSLLRDTFQAVVRLEFWVYGPDGHLASTNSRALVLHETLAARNSLEAIVSHFRSSRAPLYLSTEFGISWGAVGQFHEDGTLLHIYVLGPAICEDISSSSVEQRMQELHIPLDFREPFAQYLTQMPLVVVNNMFTYIRMLHYGANAEAVLNSDIQTLSRYWAPQKSGGPRTERQRTWQAEMRLLRMVQEGNMDYRRALADASTFSCGVRVHLGNHLRRAQVSGVAFTTLCTRAAILGGVTPELAYTRGDTYIQSLMECQSAAGVLSVNHAMYEDFIHMVRKARQGDRTSTPVRTCRDYIELHLEEPLTLADMAARIGYTEYYLSRKFKQELGVSIGAYIKSARIERAKTLLLSSDLSVAQISDQLHFCNRTYFATEFRKIIGQTPAQYRKLNQRL